jgi:tryptophan halogenase
LQAYIFDFVKDKVNVIERNVNSSEVDADYVIDCSGKPNDYSVFHKSTCIPVNTAFVTQCYWEKPEFNHTLMIARPHGWVFGIPLQNRCSIGYLFNRDISSLSEVQEDVQCVFTDHKLTPSQDTNYLEFENYYRNTNFTERVAYNGNASFFLEPLEATSLACMDQVQRNAFDIIAQQSPIENCNLNYTRLLKEIETMIMLHYFSGSIYKTAFWEYAVKKGELVITKAIQEDLSFRNTVERALQFEQPNLCPSGEDYGLWWSGSWNQNIRGLGLETKLKKLLINSLL